MKTVEEQLEFINRTCNTDYKSMEDVDWDYISKYQILSKDFMDEFNININQPKKIIWTEPSPYDKAIILTEPTGPLEEDPLQLKTRNIKLYENELLEVLKNPQLPTLITNIQDLELLLHKIDKQINENNFYNASALYRKGVESKNKLESARASILKDLGAKAEDNLILN